MVSELQALKCFNSLFTHIVQAWLQRNGRKLIVSRLVFTSVIIYFKF